MPSTALYFVPSNKGVARIFFQGGSEGYILHFQEGQRPHFCALYGQNKKNSPARGSADPPPDPLPSGDGHANLCTAAGLNGLSACALSPVVVHVVASYNFLVVKCEVTTSCFTIQNRFKSHRQGMFLGMLYV